MMAIHVTIQIVQVISRCMLLSFIPSRVFALSNCDAEFDKVEKLNIKTIVNDTPLTKLAKELDSCGWNDLTVLSHNKQNGYLHFQVLSLLSENYIRFTLYTITKDEIDQVLRNEYVKKRQTNFILLSDSSDILIEIQRLFYKYSKGEFALLPQRSNWLLLREGEVPMSNQTTQQLVFDNVASGIITKKGISKVHTLLWRQRRLRKWEHVELGSHCTIFPNRDNNFNGRTLTWAVTNFFYGLYLSNNSLGQPEYAGFFVDVSRELANLLNFTSDYDPPPIEGPLNSLPDFEVMVKEKDNVDLGLFYYSQDAALPRGLKGTYPMLFDHIAAAYVYKKSSQKMKLDFLGQHRDTFLSLLAAAFFASLLFYQNISYIARMIKGKEGVQVFDEQNTSNDDSKSKDITGGVNAIDQKTKNNLSYSFKNSGQDSKTRLSNLDKKRFSFGNKFIHLVYHIYTSFPEFHVFAFLGSIFGQGTVVRPQRLSLRIFVFFWSFFIVFISSLFSGTLTAGFVKPSIGPPFTTVSQALQSDDVECGSFKITEIHNSSKAWTIDGEKWTGQLHHFPIALHTSTPLMFRQLMEQPSKKTKMFIYYKNLLLYVKQQTDFEDLYIIDNAYQQALLGFVAPPESELTESISNALIKLHESGIIQDLIAKHLPVNIKESSKLLNEGSSATNPGVDYFSNFFMIVSACVGLSCLALLLEFFVKYVTAYYKFDPLTA